MLTLECFPFAPVVELSAQRLQGAGLAGEARLRCPEPLPAASAARGDESSSLVRFARPSPQRLPAPLQPTALGEAPISGAHEALLASADPKSAYFLICVQ